MAEIEAEAYVEFAIAASVVPSVRKNFNLPESDLRPWETVSVIPDDAPLLNGQPTATPLWCKTRPFTSLEGLAVLGNRLEPSEIVLEDVDAFWLPYANSYNEITGSWRTWQSTGQQFSWEQPSPVLQPEFSEIDYRLGKEIITVPVVRFRDGQYFFSNFNVGAMAVTFSLSFVALLGAPAENPYPLIDWGAAGWVGGPPDTRTYITIDEVIRYSWAGVKEAVDPLVPVTSMIPAYITLVVNPPSVTLYISTGPRNTWSTTKSVEPGVGTSGTPLQFSLGGSQNPKWSESNMGILAMSLWGKPLSFSEVTALNSTYASVWGASNDWS